MSQANVELDAIRTFRVSLIKFIETAGACLADADSDVTRTIHWLELEQVPHWQTQIRRREELVGRCKDAVRQKLLYKDVVGGRSSAIDEQKALKKAEALLIEAQEKYTASRQYVRRLQKQQMEYKGQVQKLALTLTGNLALAVAKMQNLYNTVAEYSKTDAPAEQRSMAQLAVEKAPQQPSSAQQPSEPPATGT